MRCIFPRTTDRVEKNTKSKINEINREKMLSSIAIYEDADAESIEGRIEELEREWDTERLLETSAASLTLAGIVLGLAVNKKWFLLSGAAGGFLLQHALQGWCPPLPIIRRMGIRTPTEILEEKAILKYLKGDFDSF